MQAHWHHSNVVSVLAASVVIQDLGDEMGTWQVRSTMTSDLMLKSKTMTCDTTRMPKP
jgi:hypothetical protein